MADNLFADFLQRFGALAAGAESQEETTRMARLFWFYEEFGLIREQKIDRFQDVVFVVGSVQQLFDAVETIQSRRWR